MEMILKPTTRNLMTLSRTISCQSRARHSGQSLVEYAVLIALIAVVAISVLSSIGSSSSKSFDTAGRALGGPTTGSSTTSPTATQPNAIGTGSTQIKTESSRLQNPHQSIRESNITATNQITSVIHAVPKRP
jgi:Flp pilus assembly pilin Flp